MAASTVEPLNKKSRDAFIAYYKKAQSLQNVTRAEQRSRLEKVDRAYQRELDRTKEQQRAAAANAAGDSDRFQNITVPVVMPAVETAVVHQTSVFLTGFPLFGVVAGPQFIDAALQMETLIDEQSIKGGWTRELMLSFRDGYKYNFAPVEVTWEEQVTLAVETDLSVDTQKGTTKEVIWSGNKVKRWDPYNTFVDTRVPPTQVAKRGEFAGHTEFMSRIELKMFIEALPDKMISTLRDALESGNGTRNVDSSAMNFYEPDINPKISDKDSIGDGSNWMAWADLSDKESPIQYKDAYEVTTMYARVLPAEFGLRISNRNIPHIYKLIIINHEHIIYCERQTNAHNLIPVLIGQPLEDGLGYQTKSLADNVDPFQAVTSAYMNSILHSRRRAITDRVLYDPSRITAAHINSSNPAAKIPVKPAAYGKNIADAVYQFPYREDQAGFSMQQINQLLGLTNQMTGQNQASQGQFVKGNKTLHEFESVMQNANGRDQMASILLEVQVFTPMKEILKLNILQYQGGTTVYNRDKQQAIEIDPIQLRKAVLEFKVTDGLVPTDKIINSETFSVAMQVIGSSPQIAQGYNVGSLFSYFMKTQGARISEFEKSQEQLAYEQALGAWQQLAQTGIENGIDPKQLPPQPLPEQYGFNPAGSDPANGEGSQVESTVADTTAT